MGGLPFGPCILYDYVRDKESGKINILRRCSGVDQEKNANFMETGESLCVQYLSLEAFSNADFVASAFHAGTGQISFGSDWRQKADCTLSCKRDSKGYAREIKIFNYHETSFHGNLTHLSRCPLFKAVEKKVSLGNYLDEEYVEAEEEILLSPHLKRLKQRVKRLQFFETKRKETSFAARKIGSKEGEDSSDDIKRAYAAALSAVDPASIIFTYNVVHECDLMHTNKVPDPSLWGGTKNRFPSSGTVGQLRSCIRKYYPYDSVLGLKGQNSFLVESFLKKIVERPPNSARLLSMQGEDLSSNDFGGFVIIAGGRETRSDDGILPRAFGFCHQRTTLDLEHLGNFTRWQAAEMYGSKEAGDKKLTELCARPGTLARTSFHKNGECISLEYFRWLLKERSLRDFEIRHLIFYRHKHYLSDFVGDMLQQRHSLRNDKDASLMRNLLKLLVNGFYG